mgnify:FL=1
MNFIIITLATQKGVTLNYLTTDYESADFAPESFDCIVLIFAHMHPLKRRAYHRKLAGFLKPRGSLILEGFSKKQIQNNTGGPRNIDMLFSEEELRTDFINFFSLQVASADIELDEGLFHRGTASVIRVAGKK